MSKIKKGSYLSRIISQKDKLKWKYKLLKQENQQLNDRIEKALSIIKEKVKDEYGIIDTGVVWEIESILKGVKDE